MNASEAIFGSVVAVCIAGHGYIGLSPKVSHAVRLARVGSR